MWSSSHWRERDIDTFYSAKFVCTVVNTHSLFNCIKKCVDTQKIVYIFKEKNKALWIRFLKINDLSPSELKSP